jgi:hypothetical protein
MWHIGRLPEVAALIPALLVKKSIGGVLILVRQG